MIKHTPAPWYVAKPDTIRAQEPRIRDYMPAIRSDNTGKEIAIITMTSTSSDETSANADLIAAAPELLEALKDLADVFEAIDGKRSVRLQNALAVIKKAEGEND